MAVSRRIAVFGVCFGLQAIGEAFGAAVVRAPSPAHGKTSAISHDGDALFAAVPSPFIATRYHSLCLDARTLPDELVACAHSEDGAVQAVTHRNLPVSGVQFHPESVLSDHGERIVRNALRIDSAPRP